jgi:transposase
MKYAPVQVLPDVPAGGVAAGIDWAVADHVACVVDMAGRVTDRFSAVHDKAGIAMLIARLRRSGAGEVAIERGNGVLVEALLAAGLTVVVISPHRVKNLRARYRSGGGKDDRFDSFVLADTLRTDRARLRPLVPDTPVTLALRAAVRARKDLVAHRVRACNQLRAHLAVAFPAAIGLFAELDSPVSLRFLAGFGSQDAAAALDEQALLGWLAAGPGRGRGNTAPASVLCARLRAAPGGVTGEEGAAHAVITTALAATAGMLAAQIKILETAIGVQLAAHPDAHIFTSLPRAGMLRAARLLAEIGDCRSRYPGPQALAALAGVVPVTRASGTHTSHAFRWAVSRPLRDAVCDFADGSRHASPWAQSVYQAARDRGKDHQHAVRILGRAWIIIIWRCWQEGIPYDPAKHTALQAVLDQQAAQAATAAPAGGISPCPAADSAPSKSPPAPPQPPRSATAAPAAATWNQ